MHMQYSTQSTVLFFMISYHTDLPPSETNMVVKLAWKATKHVLTTLYTPTRRQYYFWKFQQHAYPKTLAEKP